MKFSKSDVEECMQKEHNLLCESFGDRLDHAWNQYKQRVGQ